MAWSIQPAGSWGIATTTAPGSERAAAMALPGSWLHDANPNAGGSQRVFVRKDQWGPLAAAPLAERVTPPSGTTAGGTVVTLHGSGLTGTTGVTFGATAGTALAVINDAVVQITTPAKSAGAVNVVLQNPRGNQTLTNGFTYV